MTLKPTTRRERRIAARRQQILDAAATIFADKGFQRTTTKEIADLADVAEGTIYNYFQSKDDLLMELIKQIGALDERQQVFDASLYLEAHQFFENYFIQRLHDVGTHYRVFVSVLPEILNSPELRKQFQEGFMTPALTMVEQHIQQRIEMGQIEPMNVALFVRVFTATILGLQVLMRLDDPIIEETWQNPEELMQMLAHLFLPPTTPRQHSKGTSTAGAPDVT